MRYFFSFTNTMHHYFIGKITLEELKAGQFVFSKDRGTMLAGHIPTKVTIYNKEKPYLLPNAYSVVGEDQLDESVKEKWRTFYQLLIEKDKAGEIIWQRGGESYMRKIVEYLKSGHEAVFDGQLQKLEWYKWLDEEPSNKKKKVQPFVEERYGGLPAAIQAMPIDIAFGNGRRGDDEEEMPEMPMGIEEEDGAPRPRRNQRPAFARAAPPAGLGYYNPNAEGRPDND